MVDCGNLNWQWLTTQHYHRSFEKKKKTGCHSCQRSKLYCFKVKSSQRKIDRCPLYSHFQLITNNINGYPFVLRNFYGEILHTFSFHFTSSSISFNRPTSDPTKDSKDTEKTLFCSRLSLNYKPKDTKKWSVGWFSRSFFILFILQTIYFLIVPTEEEENRFAFWFPIKSGFQRFKDP